MPLSLLGQDVQQSGNNCGIYCRRKHGQNECFKNLSGRRGKETSGRLNRIHIRKNKNNFLKERSFDHPWSWNGKSVLDVSRDKLQLHQRTLVVQRLNSRRRDYIINSISESSSNVRGCFNRNTLICHQHHESHNNPLLIWAVVRPSPGCMRWKVTKPC